jgi:hypothetical protein
MNYLKEKGVTAKTIMLCIMSERHGGGETLSVSPYGERSEDYKK